MRNSDLFEVRLDRNHHRDTVRLSCHSRVYDVHYAVDLRAMWGDPRPLADFMEQLIGGTLHAWDRARVSPASGREMAQALMPHWEREIHQRMERMEYQQRRHAEPRYYFDEMARIDPAQWDALRYGLGAWTNGPAEDPKAKQKARELLIRNLDAGQEKSFKADGSFRVTAKDGKVYTIKTARSFNVVAEDGTKYCGQLVDTPIEDQMLAQKLLLQHDPEKFFKNANVSPAIATPTIATEIHQRWLAQTEMLMQRPQIFRWDSNI